jgi:hypothetical protein
MVCVCRLWSCCCALAVWAQDLSPGLPKLSTNDHLRSASTFHSLYAISSQVLGLPRALLLTSVSKGRAVR